MSYPLSAVIEGLVRVVERVEGPEDPRCFQVLGAAYVAAVDLRTRAGVTCGTVGKRGAEPIGGLTEAHREIASADRHDPSLAYASLVRGLLGMERALADVALEPDAAGVVGLHEVWPGMTGLGGRVRWWIRPRSLWSAVLEGDERRTRRQVYGLAPERLLRRIGLDWDREDTFGDLAPCDVAEGDPYASAVLRVRDHSPHIEGALRVVLHPLTEGLWPWFHLVDAGGRWVVDVHGDRYNDVTALEGALTSAVAGARQSADPQLLVFPELMVDERARPGVRTAVRATGGPVFGVVAGSAHMTLGDGRRVSQALVLDRDGEPWWAHHKRGSFRCVGKHIVASRTAGRMFVPQDVPVDEEAPYHEAFVEGTCLRFCDSSLGRIVVLVCADLLDEQAWSRAIDRLEPDFLVVVSMSEHAAPFLERAKVLAEGRRVSTLYVNASCDVGVSDAAAPDVDVLAFAHLAIDDARVCWRRGRGLERWDHRKAAWTAYTGTLFGIEGGGMWADLGSLLAKR
ncbi:MAG: hypothetical protein Q8P41_27280 [Pseudomonadota bacterium]|nr:hypothetical protein [Pseudomonadota bacterium]